jgi:RNA polymerase sigma factor (sigma-70 family)
MDETVDSETTAREALARGERKQALTLLMELYGTAIYNYCRHTLGDADDADDVLQTTFSQAFADLMTFRGETSFRSWLYGIARHRCLDKRKTEGRRKHLFENTETLPDLEAPEATAEQLALMTQYRKYLLACLGKLEAPVRDALLLRFMEQMSYEEMATLTGERAATLQMRVARAMPGLRKCLENSGVTL